MKAAKTTFLIISLLIMYVFMTGCGQNADPLDYRQKMREFVQSINDYAGSLKPDFIIIPQNGHALLTQNGESTGPLATDYCNAIDGIGREDLCYGYTGDNVATPEDERDEMVSFLDRAESAGVQALVTDYCSTHSYMDSSYAFSNAKGFISFAADHRNLDNIPAYPAIPYHTNSADITTLAQAENFLYLLDPGAFADKTAFFNAIKGTDYDLVITDLFYEGGASYTAAEITALRKKNNGASRLVIAYMSIGEAEDYRYYWQPEWTSDPPAWLAEENPNWPGNYKVRYWDPAWQQIISGNDDSYLKKIIDSGFDGVYLDIIDAYEYFEE